MSGLRSAPIVMAIGGALVIEASGSSLGDMGVSGALGSLQLSPCTNAGIKAIADLIEY